MAFADRAASRLSTAVTDDPHKVDVASPNKRGCHVHAPRMRIIMEHVK
jgi:hypothetical protein